VFTVMRVQSVYHEKMTETVKLLIYYQEVHGSNLDRDTDNNIFRDFPQFL
jgi:hypothetical protein